MGKISHGDPTAIEVSFDQFIPDLHQVRPDEVTDHTYCANDNETVKHWAMCPVNPEHRPLLLRDEYLAQKAVEVLSKIKEDQQEPFFLAVGLHR